jgi:hypothetical protein
MHASLALSVSMAIVLRRMAHVGRITERRRKRHNAEDVNRNCYERVQLACRPATVREHPQAIADTLRAGRSSLAISTVAPALWQWAIAAPSTLRA